MGVWYIAYNLGLPKKRNQRNSAKAAVVFSRWWSNQHKTILCSSLRSACFSASS